MIRPTLDLSDAAAQFWDVIVIGAGPAGSLVARELARRCCSALLVDRSAFPRWKVCGACLNGRSLATLAEAGLGELTRRNAAVPLDSLRLAAGGRSASVSLPGGAALSRFRFDAALIEEAIRCGAAFLPQTTASLDKITPTERTVLLRQSDRVSEVKGRVVIAADGLGGGVAPGRRIVRPGSRIGAGVVAENAPAFYSAGTIYMACGREGYVGAVRLEDERLDIAAALDPALLRHRRPADVVAAILAQTGWPTIPQLTELPWRGTPALSRRVSPLGAERLFVLGDAAGYIEPFTGEGMAWAMAGALALAPIAAAATRRWDEGLPARWSARYQHAVARRQGLCRAASEILRRPLLTAAALVLLCRMPWLAAPVVHRLNR
jgi:menaquinone-9 beta-reductase